MKKILFAWIGNNDLLAAENDGSRGLGPICQAMTLRPFEEAVLLANYDKDRSQNYVDWLTLRIKSSVKLKAFSLDDPTDFRLIYDCAKKVVREYLQDSKQPAELTFHLSPGTPTMATVWVILANSLFTAMLIQTSPERGLKDVDLPFELAVDYLPDLIKRRDEGLGKLFERVASDASEFSGIVYRSNSMKLLIAKARKVAPHFLPVLILGESGTGKELLAEAIHNASLRRGKFIPINCGSIPAELVESTLFGHVRGAFTGATGDKPGMVKAASGGTLFLDEIGELPLSAQVKLLRLLQEGTFTPVGATETVKTDARIVAATNRNLAEEVVAGNFREDLFYRLAVAILHVPPLREREGDIGLLIDHLLEVANQKLSEGKRNSPKKLSATARTLLLQHSWPGNVRELQNTLLRAALWEDNDTLEKQCILEALIPVSRKTDQYEVLGRIIGDGFDLEELMSEVARHYLERAMKESGGNKAKASKMLNFKNYQTLDNWLKKYSTST